MGWKNISKLHQISVPSKECVGDCIDGSKDSKKTYVEAITMVMAIPMSNNYNCVYVVK